MTHHSYFNLSCLDVASKLEPLNRFYYPDTQHFINAFIIGPILKITSLYYIMMLHVVFRII